MLNNVNNFLLIISLQRMYTPECIYVYEYIIYMYHIYIYSIVSYTVNSFLPRGFHDRLETTKVMAK